jgi:hypothetical protein
VIRVEPGRNAGLQYREQFQSRSVQDVLDVAMGPSIVSARLGKQPPDIPVEGSFIGGPRSRYLAMSDH